MQNIKAIAITLLAPMEDHIANGGEKLLGNASSIKRRPDGRVYISGQMQRQALFSAMERLNEDDPNKGDSYVSNGDGITDLIETDLRADLGGFMHPSAGSYSGRRTAPVSASYAVAQKPSELSRDLLVRLKQDPKESEQKQALATNEVSQADMMEMSFFLDVAALSITKLYEYADKHHVSSRHIKHVSENERLRRAKLYLESTASLTDYANQARNAVSGEPQKVFIVLDSKLSRKSKRFFAMTDIERERLMAELAARGASYFVGDDTDAEAKSVAEAYQAAQNELNSLYDPSNDADPVPFEAVKEGKA